MPASYERINYNLRPAKHIERRMLGEAFGLLSEFDRLWSYRYIGFGSIYFSDHKFFHRVLGISNMVSIEKDTQNSARFEFNRPYACIDIKFGESNTVLPNLSWAEPTILWLDYDGTLNGDVLLDVGCFCTRAIPGSVLIVSVNATGLNRSVLSDDADEDGTKQGQALDKLRKTVGEDRVPASTVARDLNGWGTAKVFRSIIDNHNNTILTERNGGLVQGKKICYQQLFNFHYADNAKMLTVGGIIYDQSQQSLVDNCGFDRLTFVRKDESPYHIVSPLLTYREIRHLDRQLPGQPEDAVPTADGVPEKDRNNYKEIYRYFPSFTDVDL